MINIPVLDALPQNADWLRREDLFKEWKRLQSAVVAKSFDPFQLRDEQGRWLREDPGRWVRDEHGEWTRAEHAEWTRGGAPSETVSAQEVEDVNEMLRRTLGAYDPEQHQQDEPLWRLDGQGFLYPNGITDEAGGGHESEAELQWRRAGHPHPYDRNNPIQATDTFCRASGAIRVDVTSYGADIYGYNPTDQSLVVTVYAPVSEAQLRVIHEMVDREDVDTDLKFAVDEPGISPVAILMSHNRGYRDFIKDLGKHGYLPSGLPDNLLKAYDPDEARDPRGEWTAGGASMEPDRAAGARGAAAIQSWFKGLPDQRADVINGLGLNLDSSPSFQALARHYGESSDQTIGRILDAWSDSSIDTAESLMLQRTAAKVFGLRGAWLRDLPRGGRSEKGAAALAPYEEAFKDFLINQYEWTQQLLQEGGVRQVTLYRGIQFSDGMPAHALPFDKKVHEADLDNQPISSYTTDFGTAEKFTAWGDPAPTALVEVTVPAEKIFGLATTGVGELGENEVLLLGGTHRGRILSWNGSMDPGAKRRAFGVRA